jgi:multidrug efflux pump subunit AcrA (membrane-fusion protein)
MRKIILVVLGILVLAGSSYFAYGLVTAPKEVKKAKNLTYKPVGVDTIQNRNIPVIVDANGSTEALKKFELFSEVEGVFEYSSKSFRPGQKFNKGDVLFRLNNEEFKANVISAKSDFFNLIVSIIPDIKLDFPDQYEAWQNYLDDFSVNKPLKEFPETSKQLTYFITGRGLLSSYYNIKNLEVRLNKFNIVAPFTGILSEASINPGTLIRPGQRLGVFIDPSIYEVQISLQKSMIPYMKVKDTVKLSALDGSVSTLGEIVRINSQIDQETQTVQVFVQVKDDNVKEGQYLKAEIQAQTIENAYPINRSLINNDNQIFVVNDTVLAYKTVKPVYFYEQKAIVKGLNDGDVIMTSNLSSAYPGMLVKVE